MRVLVAGGVEFPGRELVAYLVARDDVTYIRVADKLMPSMAPLSAAQAAAFESPRVEYVQADLRMGSHVQRAFAFEDGEAPFDCVFNCFAETRCGRDEDEYRMRTLDSAVKIATAAMEKCVYCLIYVVLMTDYSAIILILLIGYYHLLAVCRASSSSSPLRQCMPTIGRSRSKRRAKRTTLLLGSSRRASSSRRRTRCVRLRDSRS